MLGTEKERRRREFLQNIVNEIGSIDERDQLQAVFEAVKGRADELTARAARAFARGEIVAFDHKGTTCVGRIEKVNRKTISVAVVNPDTYAGVWKVSPSLCRNWNGPELVEVDAPAGTARQWEMAEVDLK